MTNKETQSKELISYRYHALKAAKDFWYGDAVIEQIKNAKTVGEIERIMRNARHKKFK